MSAEQGLIAAGVTFGFGGLFATLSWKADEAVSPEFKQWLSGRIKVQEVRRIGTTFPSAFAAILDHIFGKDPISLKFIFRSFLASAVTITILFFVYANQIPGFLRSIIEDPYQRSSVIEQLISFSLFVNLVTDYLCLAYCREVIWKMQDRGDSTHLSYFLLRDLFMKVLLFIIASAFVYGLFVESRGSFGGNILLAAKAFPETLWGGIRFQNLSAVYIFSCLISSFWLWAYLLAWALLRMGSHVPRLVQTFKWIFPIDERPLRSLGLVASGLAMIAYWVITLANRAVGVLA